MSEMQAAEVARARWGIAGATARRLASEHDDTFRLTLADGSRRFLRVSAPDPVATPGHPSFLTGILLHLEQNDSAIPVQRVQYSPGGTAEVLLDDGRLARMTTFLEGRLLADVPSTPALRREIGATLARLSRALRSFRHPAARRTHQWDLQNAPALRPLLADLADLAPRGVRGVAPPGGLRLTQRAPLTEVLDRFEAVVRPALAAAPTQVIHTDFHGENLLVSEDATTICGVLDFGDSLTGPVAMDVAVAACYQLGAGPDPAGGLGDLLGPALDVVAGYHAADPLRPADLPLIREFILLRLATRVIVSQWNAAREPSNSGYLLRRTGQAIEHFEAFGTIPAEDVVSRLRTACELEAIG
jgi:hydroxylysine kinase